MKALDEAGEWLRPLVTSRAWDYCIAWKFEGDPSGFLEWMNCCCIGGGADRGGVKVKEEEGENSSNYCRDIKMKHPVRTRACQALLSIPASLHLSAGVHREAFLSDKPTWIYQTNPSQEIVSTRVLIPVTGGVLELFAFKNIEEDHKIVELITSEFKDLKRYVSLIHQNLLQSSNVHNNYDGSSSSSNFSEIQSYDPYSTLIPNANLLRFDQMGLGYSKIPISGNSKPSMKSKRLSTPSRNLAAERNRRDKIKQLLYSLRATVPNISKMDQTAILDDAIEYIVKLQKDMSRLNEELKELESDGNAESAAQENRVSQKTKSFEKVVMHMEVKQIDKRDFLLKIFHEKLHGGTVRLMDAVFSLRLRIVDANITTANDKVLNILRVEAMKQDLQPEKLRDLLLEAVECRLQR